jgi:hypothetical protein
LEYRTLKNKLYTGADKKMKGFSGPAWGLAAGGSSIGGAASGSPIDGMTRF